MVIRTLVQIALLSVSALVQAAQAPVRLGQVYPIEERDVLQVIQEKLSAMEKSGILQAFEKEVIAKNRQRILHPPGVHLPRAQVLRSWRFDPTYTAPRNIVDHLGQTVVKAGTQVNPLEQVALSAPLVFFDAGDEVQLGQVADFRKRWAQAKLILTNGNWSAVAERFGPPVFFDQKATLIKTFGIEALPAVVDQQELHLRVREIPEITQIPTDDEGHGE